MPSCQADLGCQKAKAVPWLDKNLCLELPLEGSSPAWLPGAASPRSPGQPAAARCVPGLRARRAPPSLHARSTSAAKMQKSPRCPSDTHLFQLRKHHQLFCSERTPQPGTPTAAPGCSTGGRLGAPTPPQEPAEPVWVGSPAPRQGPPARGTQHPTVHLHGSAGCCLPPGAPRWGCWLRLSLLARALKAHLACFGTA